MDYDEHNPIKPKRRWFQYRLKSLFVLTLGVGLLLALYLYWDDWRKQRPPFRDYDNRQYRAAFHDFVHDVATGNLDHAYDSTSVRFKTQMTRSRFQEMIDHYPTLRLPGMPSDWNGSAWDKINTHLVGYLCHDFEGVEVPPTKWSTNCIAIEGPEGRVVEFWLWVVRRDSFLYHRPPPARVEDIEIREMDSAKWLKEFDLDLPRKPHSERE
jgi:hypothetical protein